MPSFNQVLLIGHLGKDAEKRTFQNGGEIVNLTLATSESWKDKATGERKESTQWHKVVVKAPAMVGYTSGLKKGTLVMVQGQVEYQKYTNKDGKEAYATEIVVKPFGGSVKNFSPKEAAAAPAAVEDDEQIPF